MIGTDARSAVAVAAIAITLGFPAAPLQAEGDAARGEVLFRPCAACHQIGEGAISRIGPHLNGLIGRPIGTVDGYDYSETLLNAGEAGDIWTEATLETFLEDPDAYLPDSYMVFRGIRDVDDRRDLVAYILQEGGTAETAVAAGAETGPSPEIAAILAIDGDVAYGEYLSSECTACHSGSGGEGIPAITGLAPSIFIAGLEAYRSGDREHQVMNMLASRLGDEEIAALAAYFVSLSD